MDSKISFEDWQKIISRVFDTSMELYEYLLRNHAIDNEMFKKLPVPSSLEYIAGVYVDFPIGTPGN